MRVLVTTDVVGGVWSYTEELTDALTRQGHTVFLAAFGGEPSRAQRAWLAARPGLDFTVLPYPLEWMPQPEPELSRSVEALRATVARLAPDVIHLNQYYYGAFDLGAPKLVVAHSDVVSWWRAVRGEDPPASAWFGRYRRWVREGLTGADLRVAPSTWLARQVETIYGVGPVRVVHNGRSPLRSERGLPAGAAGPEGLRRERRVVAAGRLWDEGKGVRDLVDAAARLAPDVEVVVAGAARHPTGGEDFPTAVPGIRWAGVLSATGLRLLLGRTRVYAATSRYEPFGLTPVEAALAGCALVASDIPSFRELWDGCALFYPPGDGAALAAAVRELMDDDDRRGRLAVAARGRALWRFTPERMADGYQALYRELLQRRPSSTAGAGVDAAP